MMAAYTPQCKLNYFCICIVKKTFVKLKEDLTEWVIAEAREDHDDVGVVIDAVVNGEIQDQVEAETLDIVYIYSSYPPMN